MEDNRHSRRSMLMGSAAFASGIAGLASSPSRSAAADGSQAISQPASPSDGSQAPKRVLRFAHLTDVHVQADRRGEEGFATALNHVQSLEDPPAFVFFGGDNVMNVDSSNGAQTANEQLSIWKRCLKNELRLPSYACIGNHDILNSDPVDGKKWAVDAYELPNRYYRFAQSGWNFIVLDSTSPEPGGYKARLDAEQMDWLKSTLQELEGAGPVMILSHIPILAACAYFDGDNEKTGNWVVPGAWMHVDAREIKELFRRYPNVRAAASGHIHLVDEVSYNRVSYYCNGAVCGGWWKGPCQEFENGYALIDLFDDGSSRRAYVEYGWKS